MKDKQNRRIVITGGHFTPALAVIDELKKRKGWEIYYFSRKFAFEGKNVLAEEYLEIPRTGTKYIFIFTGRLQRRFTRHTIPSLFKIPIGFFQSLYYLWRIKPGVILSFGSYSSTPVVIAGWFLRIPIISHEQTIAWGLANKINSFFSRKIAVSYRESLKMFPRNKVVYTGNPLRKEVFDPKITPLAREVLFRKRKIGLPLIYITGGNSGAKIINQTVVELLQKILKKFIVVHQSGILDFKTIEMYSENFSETMKERYFLKSFWPSEEIGWIFKNSEFVISRSGANICYELGALKKPAILIPLPFSQKNEQLENAKQLTSCGLGMVLEQKELTAQNLWWAIEELAGRKLKYQGIKKILNEVYPTDGAEKLTDLIYELINQKN